MRYETYDIVINGGSFGAVASALQAARENADLRILLIEPTDWLGGQSTSQGVAAIDNAWQEPARSLFKDSPENYYPKDYLSFIERLKTNLDNYPGYGYGGEDCCWVSRDCFDPRSAAFILEKMVGEYPNITLKKLTVVKKVITEKSKDEFGNGKKIISISLITRIPKTGYKPFEKFLSEEILDWYSENDSEFYSKELFEIIPNDRNKGFTVIDASELGDIIVLSEADYTVGREINKEDIENGILPLFDEDAQQSFVFCFCIKGTEQQLDEENLKQPFIDFDKYYEIQKDHYFSFGNHSWEKIWTYRRLKRAIDDKARDGQFNIGDISMQNWYPGNDYPYGAIFKTKTETKKEINDWCGGIRIQEIAAAEKHAIAWYFYYKEKKHHDIKIKFLKDNDPENMMGTGTGLSKMPYFRDTRRIIGLNYFRILEKDYNTDKYTSRKYFDSVGIGQYAADIHPIKGHDEGLCPGIEAPLPFYIPYRALASNNVRNLLASGKNYSLSYITNSAYRLHPIEWAAGTAAGSAAVSMMTDSLKNYQILGSKNLKKLQEKISLNSPICWKAYDK